MAAVEEKPVDIVVLPGDGIGDIVCRETLRVMDAAGFKATYHFGDIGWEFWCRGLCFFFLSFSLSFKRFCAYFFSKNQKSKKKN